MCTDMDIKDHQIAQLQKEVAELKSVIAHQNELIAQLRHQLFGTSSEKSGRINPKDNTNTSGERGSDNANNKGGKDSKKKRIPKVAEEENCQRN